MTDYKPKREWDRINKFFADCPHEIAPRELGTVFKEYVEESIHGGWDGFDSDDVRSIRRFLTDFVTYYQNR